MTRFSSTVSSASSWSCWGTTPRRARIRRPCGRRVEAEDPQLAGGGRRGAADHPHRRRLAGAVGSEEAERLAAVDLDVDAVDGGEVAEALDQAACFDQRSGGHAASVHLEQSRRTINPRTNRPAWGAEFHPCASSSGSPASTSGPRRQRSKSVLIAGQITPRHLAKAEDLAVGRGQFAPPRSGSPTSPVRVAGGKAPPCCSAPGRRRCWSRVERRTEEDVRP